jgi:hypothetical protein
MKIQEQLQNYSGMQVLSLWVLVQLVLMVSWTLQEMYI